ncbi:MAG: CAP domain-containing protein, partial [Spirochaetaceae bacterium]|nr:CAP domain-containing protein [Spirochaetaceae bacterium]
QGPRGTTGHAGSNGSSPRDRLNRYGAWGVNVGENISYGGATGQDIVVQLLIDDGVPSRGHRKNNMESAFAFAGVGVGAHKVYGTMAVLDFAAAYTEK